MGNRPWATTQMLTHLKANIRAFEAAQERKRTKVFMTRFLGDWFTVHPAPRGPNMTAEQGRALMSKRIRAWFNNHTGTRGDKTRLQTRNVRESLQRMLSGKSPKKKQKLQLTQAYSDIYWEKKLKTIIDDGWKLERAMDSTLGHKDFIKYMNGRIRELYAAESPEVQAEVEAHRDALTANVAYDEDEARPGDELLDKEEYTRVKECCAKQRAIGNLQLVLSEMSRVVEEQTGHVMVCHVGGPEPARNGRIIVHSITTGLTAGLQQRYEEQHPQYKTQVQDAFKTFVKECFTEADRKAASIDDIDTPLADQFSAALTLSPNTAITDVAMHVERRPPIRNDNDNDDDDGDDGDGDDGDGDDDDVNMSELDERENSSVDTNTSPSPAPSGADSGLEVVSRTVINGVETVRLRDGRRMTSFELNRLHNIQRNKISMEALNIDEALRFLTLRQPAAGKAKTRKAATTGPTPPVRRLPNRASRARVNYRTPAIIEDEDDGAPQPGMALFTAANTPTSGVTPTDESSPIAPGGTLVNATVAPASGATPADESSPITPGGTLVTATAPPASGVMPADESSPITPGEAPVTASTILASDNTSSATFGTQASPLSRSVCENNLEMDVDCPVSSKVSVQPSDLSPAERLAEIDITMLPEWMQTPFAFFLAKYRGEGEDELLLNWHTFEMSVRDSRLCDQLLAAVNRPLVVREWNQRKRVITSIPKIDIRVYPGQWRAWLKALMPDWRFMDDLDWPFSRCTPESEPWTSVRKGGKNGIFLIVLTLFWWRSVAKTNNELAEYLSALEEASWLFTQLVDMGMPAGVNTQPATVSKAPRAKPSASRSKPSVSKENVSVSAMRATRSASSVTRKRYSAM
ncbi:hypothetical protein DFH11DRAFT_1555174 [Phellopilus nigrolimitatus]|nr:hypothetical protein DFH11DRAFT_1555174 [Phellopilus nigrolimitatus]